MRVQNFQFQLEELVADTKIINEIASPTFDEGRKAEFVKGRFDEIGLEQVQLDSVGNVLGYLPGQENGGEVVLAAHIDTVFPHGTDLTVRQANGRLNGPGVGDNSLAVAALLAVARFFKGNYPRPRRTLLFVATVGEEGLGDLRGIRALMQKYEAEKRSPGALIAIEGHGLGNICHQGVGSRRMRVTVEGPGGHSWDKASRPSAIHALAQIMERMTRIAIPARPRTSFNIGTIEGGISVNTIAPSASMVFEVRSVEENSLTETFNKMTTIIKDFRADDISVKTELVGNRPAGGIPANSPIVEICSQVYRDLGFEPTYVGFSTDANLALSLGLSAVCLGISRGANAHRTDEWIEIEPAAAGVEALARVAMELVL